MTHASNRSRTFTCGSFLLAVGALALLSRPQAASAQFSTDTTLTFGAQAQLSIYNCTVAPGCAPLNNIAPQPSLVFSGTLSAVDQTTFPYGNLNVPPAAAAFVQDSALSAQVNNQLSIHTASSDAGRVTESGWVLEGFTWNGTGPAQRSVGGVWSFTQTGTPGLGPQEVPQSLVSPSVAVFTTGSETATLLANCALSANTVTTCVKGATLLGASSFTYDNPAPNVPLSAPSDFTVNLNPGETVFVLTQLGLATELGGSAAADIYPNWNLYAGLTPTGVQLPEPGTALLLGTGLAFLPWTRRRAARRAITSS